jgi:hypothetical protein
MARKILSCKRGLDKKSIGQWDNSNIVKKQILKNQVWDKYQFTFGKGSSF